MKNLKKIIIFLLITQSLYSSEQTTDEKEAIKIGKASATLLQSTLKGKMKKELKTANKVQMVSFCIDQALEITKGVNNLLPSGVTVSRTSLKYRSKHNKPSKDDTQYLNYFQNRFDQGRNIKNEFKLVKSPEGYKYYKPIMISKKCLTCHGHKKNMNPLILQKLEDEYPDNKAYNYKDGDFRGLILVEINHKTYQ